jgi:hypothetical protein
MSKIRKYFWCAGSFCNHDKHPMNELTQELKNRKLCKTCFDKGARLALGVIVVQVVNPLPDSAVKEVK